MGQSSDAVEQSDHKRCECTVLPERCGNERFRPFRHAYPGICVSRGSANGTHSVGESNCLSYNIYDCFQVRARILNPCVDVPSNQPHLAGLM